MEKMRLPYSLSLAFSMSLRMIPLMAEQAQKIVDSQRARGLDLESGNFLRRIKNLIPILVPMVVLSIKRSVEIAEALEARGFGSERRTRYFDIEMRCQDFVVTAASLAIVVLYVFLVFVLGYTNF
jgi:energy-coupling factor transport system permease protein